MMTDKQLQILLKQYLSQIERAIKEAETELPIYLVEKRKNFFGMENEYIPALQKLYEFRNNLNEDIKSIENKKDE